MRKAGLYVALACVLALPATAGANTYKLRGGIVGSPGTGATAQVKKKSGEIKQIRSLEFKRVPVRCEDGSTGTLNATFPQFGVNGKDFTRRTRIQGTGIQNGFVRVSGKFRRNGRVVKGFVRFSFKSSAGSGCGSDTVRWKARK